MDQSAVGNLCSFLLDQATWQLAQPFSSLSAVELLSGFFARVASRDRYVDGLASGLKLYPHHIFCPPCEGFFFALSLLTACQTGSDTRADQATQARPFQCRVEQPPYLRLTFHRQGLSQ